MKNIILYTSLLLLSLSACKNVAVNKQSDLQVWGNCNMCKKTIESSLDVAGIDKADWNKDTKILHVAYDSTIVNLTGIEQLIAKAGYDTENQIADQAAYDGLHECCKYDRKAE